MQSYLSQFALSIIAYLIKMKAIKSSGFMPIQFLIQVCLKDLRQ